MNPNMNYNINLRINEKVNQRNQINTFSANWSRSKMATIIRAIFSGSFSCIFINFWLNFPLQWVQLTISQQGLISLIGVENSDEPLSEPMMVYFTDAYMRHLATVCVVCNTLKPHNTHAHANDSLLMACCLYDTKNYLGQWPTFYLEYISGKFCSKFTQLRLRRCNWKRIRWNRVRFLLRCWPAYVIHLSVSWPLGKLPTIRLQLLGCCRPHG